VALLEKGRKIESDFRQGVESKQTAMTPEREFIEGVIPNGRCCDARMRTRWTRRRAAQELQISDKARPYKVKQMGCSEYRAS
jgi:predicted mannosyl-3-phosphoglycerate phosphatase (HAD superfamily)